MAFHISEDFQMCEGHLEEMLDSKTTKEFFRRYSANEVFQRADINSWSAHLGLRHKEEKKHSDTTL